MGRTAYNYREDEEGRLKIKKKVKHSRNSPGHGMRVINSWSEEIEGYTSDDSKDDTEQQYIVNTPQYRVT